MGDKGGGPRSAGRGLRRAPQDRLCALERPASILPVLYLPPRGAGLLCGRPEVARDCHYPRPVPPSSAPQVRGQGAAFLRGHHRCRLTLQSTRLCFKQKRRLPVPRAPFPAAREAPRTPRCCRARSASRAGVGAPVPSPSCGSLGCGREAGPGWLSLPPARQRRAGANCDMALPVRHPWGG